MAKDYLSHHGVKGQKWGVKNGPPYPLYSKSRLGRGERLTSQALDKYKNQYNNLKHVKITDSTNGRIYTKNGKVVAMVNTEKKPDGNVWIQGLEVFGDNKGKGLGKELLNVAVNDLGATHLSVRKTNSVAKHLYDNYGFKTYDSDDFMDYMKYDNLKHSGISDYLSHHGVKGQKWYVRRYQNEDGTLTNAGKRRYDKEKKQNGTLTNAGKRRYDKEKKKDVFITENERKRLGTNKLDAFLYNKYRELDRKYTNKHPDRIQKNITKNEDYFRKYADLDPSGKATKDLNKILNTRVTSMKTRKDLIKTINDFTDQIENTYINSINMRKMYQKDQRRQMQQMQQLQDMQWRQAQQMNNMVMNQMMNQTMGMGMM